MTIRIGILTGWFQGPFYYKRDDSEGYNWSIEETGEYLGLSEGLVRDLTAWDDHWQAQIDLVEGQNSGFDDKDEEHAWIERGKKLAARIKQESTIAVSIDYQANGYYEDGTCMF
ncbi:hypothetical protein [Actinoalloteichus sp. GBA129-24]|uniref:hypothetical protein n=1 Tax=Actinoalloteichus sp. GBA129-24 TaxID=1612551 RepID=UPI000950566F|nr:hypothetical protein [Actinoalloteichus sp. GBA129-24]APU22127.1 hypothetical protein UA75_20690 [Actinoalloteichus sp. GBA129-24]